MRGVCSYRQSRGRGARRDIDFGGTMHRYRLWLLAGLAFAALIVAATGSASSQSAKAGGTVVFGAEQEPGILNTDIIGGNPVWGIEEASPGFPSAIQGLPDNIFHPPRVNGVSDPPHPAPLH